MVSVEEDADGEAVGVGWGGRVERRCCVYILEGELGASVVSSCCFAWSTAKGVGCQRAGMVRLGYWCSDGGEIECGKDEDRGGRARLDEGACGAKTGSKRGKRYAKVGWAIGWVWRVE